MLIVSEKYKPLYKLFENEETDEAYSIGLDLSKDDVIDRLCSNLKDTKSINNMTNFVNYIYSVWETNFNSDINKIPFRFDDAKNAVVKIANCYKGELDLSKFDVTQTKDGFKISGRSFEFGNGSLATKSKTASGEIVTYNAYKGKQLTPQSLGLAGTFPLKSLIENLEQNLKNSNVVSTSLADVLIHVCKSLSKKKVDSIPLDDLIISGKGMKTVECDIPSKANLDEIKFAQNAITKDFGEVLGGIFMLKYLKDAVSVKYNEGQSDPLLDYVINTSNDAVGVSAKAIKGGHRPSSKIILDALKDFVVSGTEINGMTFDKLLNDNYVDAPDSVSRAKELFNILESTSDESVKSQWIHLIDYFVGNNEVVKKFCKIFGLSSFKDLLETFGEARLEKRFADKFDEVCSTKRGLTNVINLKDSLKSKIGYSSKIKLDTIEDVSKISPATKLGMFVYPIACYAVKTINDEFGLDKKNKSKVDIISAFARLAYSHRQVYLGVDIVSGDTLKLTFKFKQMDKADWAFSTGGNNTNEPFSERLSLYIV